MWYVGTSRAKNHLNIYKLKEKDIWPLTRKIDYNKLKINFKPDYPKLKFHKQRKDLIYGVTKYLEDLKPYQLYQYEEQFKFEVEEEMIFKKQNKVLDYKDFSCLYGCFIEVVFEYYYNYWLEDLPENNLFERIKYQLNNTIIVPLKFKSSYLSLKQKFTLDPNKKISLKLLDQFKMQFNEREMKLYLYINKLLENSLDKEFYLSLENKVIKQQSKKNGNYL